MAGLPPPPGARSLRADGAALWAKWAPTERAGRACSAPPRPSSPPRSNELAELAAVGRAPNGRSPPSCS